MPEALIAALTARSSLVFTRVVMKMLRASVFGSLGRPILVFIICDTISIDGNVTLCGTLSPERNDMANNLPTEKKVMEISMLFVKAIPSTQYHWIEWHADEFAGRLLMPTGNIEKAA